MLIIAMRVRAGGGAHTDLFLEGWPPEVMIRWHKIVARDLTSDPTRVDLMLKQGRREFLLHAGVQGGAGRTVWTTQVFGAPGDYRPGARFVGAILGDALELSLFGEIIGDE